MEQPESHFPTAQRKPQRQPLVGQPSNVVAICNAAWTDEVIAAYQAQLEAQTI